MNDQQDLKIYIYRRLKELGVPCIHISLSDDATMDNAEEIIETIRSLHEQHNEPLDFEFIREAHNDGLCPHDIRVAAETIARLRSRSG